VAASLARWSEPSPRGNDRFDDYNYDDLVVIPAHSAAPLGAGAPQRGAFVPPSSKCPSAAADTPMHGPAAQVCAASHSGEVDEREKCAQDLDSRPASEASTAALAARRQEVWRALQAPASDPSLPIADALRALREQLNRQPLPASSREEEEALRTRSCSTLRGHAWKVLIGGCVLWGGGGHGGTALQISCSEYLGAVSDRASAMCVLIRASPMHMELTY
jgi:hypothetical protein